MPSRPKTHKPRGKGRSDRHRRQVEDKRRGTAAQRGYDGRWQQVRRAYWQAHPYCEPCWERGMIRTEANGYRIDVDHRVPFQGKDDPLRLRWDNLQSLCRACHNAKTRRQKTA